MFSGPWLLLGSGLVLLQVMPHHQNWWLALAALATLGIVLQLLLRLWSRSQFQVPMRLWWLMGAGGLLVGGLLAAPFGALIAKRIQPRVLLFAVSIVLIATSLFSLYKALT